MTIYLKPVLCFFLHFECDFITYNSLHYVIKNNLFAVTSTLHVSNPLYDFCFIQFIMIAH